MRKINMIKEVSKGQLKILDKAQQGEIDAVYMYRKLADIVKDEKDKKVFLRLADDELRHADFFASYTNKNLKPIPTKAIIVKIIYIIFGKKRLYPIIAKGEYQAADKYKILVDIFPNIRVIMEDEIHHGDAVMSLL